MDLSLSPEDFKFKQELRAWLSEVLPEGSPRKGKNLFTQSRDDTVWWQQTLNDKGWGASSWPVEFGGTGWNDAQRQIFTQECGRAGAPMQSPFGNTMVGPVIYTFGTPEQKER